MAKSTRAQFQGTNKNKHPQLRCITAATTKNGVHKGGGGYKKNMRTGGGGGADFQIIEKWFRR